MPAHHEACATCGANDELMSLSELGFGPEHGPRALLMCPSCLERRQAASWPATSEEGQGILDALAQRENPLEERYTYLGEEQAVHLVRLRPGWVDRHAAEA